MKDFATSVETWCNTRIIRVSSQIDLAIRDKIFAETSTSLGGSLYSMTGSSEDASFVGTALGI